MSNKKQIFTVKDDSGNDIELAILRPTAKQLMDAQGTYNKTFHQALKKDDAVLRLKLEDYMRKQEVWDDEKQEKFEQIRKDIFAGQHKLESGGIKLDDAKKVALGMRENRAELISLISLRSYYDGLTVDAQAENAQFDYLVSVCVVYNDTGLPYFKSYEDYIDRKDNIVSIQAATKLAMMQHDFAPNVVEQYPENKFLKKFNFVDENWRLINKDGKFVNEDGDLVDEQGRLVNNEGKLIDINGHALKEDGSYDVDFQPFLDDDGNPIQESVVGTEVTS